jgi:hypothetical protein
MSNRGFGHKEDFAPVSHYPTLAEISEELLGTIKVFHLYVGGTQFCQRVSV